MASPGTTSSTPSIDLTQQHLVVDSGSVRWRGSSRGRSRMGLSTETVSNDTYEGDGGRRLRNLEERKGRNYRLDA